MFAAEMGQCPVPTDEIKPHGCNRPASQSDVFCHLLRSAEFDTTAPVAVNEQRKLIPQLVQDVVFDSEQSTIPVTLDSEAVDEFVPATPP